LETKYGAVGKLPGLAPYWAQAIQLQKSHIQKECGHSPDPRGGTQTNLNPIPLFLRPHEAVNQRQPAIFCFMKPGAIEATVPKSFDP
jgi:hypothetical protein